MTLPQVLRKALGRVRDQQVAYLESPSARYRLMPSDASRGFTLLRSIRYNHEWQPWFEADGFDIDDILYEKWRLV
jgi:LPS sulfotransferase NodH